MIDISRRCFDRMTLKGGAISRLVKQSLTALTVFSLMTLGLTLAGCGGSSGAAGTPGAVSAKVVSGTAAVGAPLAGQVSLRDSSTPPLQKSTVIAADGAFAIDVTGMQAPYLLQAKGSANGTEYTLHSFSVGTGTANINPLANAIVASAGGDDDPEAAYETSDSDKHHKIKNNLAKTVSMLLTKLAPLLKEYGEEHTNPITSSYIEHHLHMDGMYGRVDITVANGTLTITNNKNSAVIFIGQVSDIANGIFDNAALPPAAAAPAAPAGLTATGGTGRVTLSWVPVSTATSYNVYYATSAGVTKTGGTKVGPVSSPYSQTGLTAATTYYYIVTAVNAAGESAASSEASAATASSPPVSALPTAPGSVSATGGTNQVTLSWGVVGTATSYNLYYSTTSGVTVSSGTRVTGATPPAVLTGLTEGTTYYCIVTAVNSAGEGAPSIQAAAATLVATPNPTVPAAPATITAVGGDTQATVSWPAVTGAASYNIYWSPTSGVTKTNGTKIAGATSPYITTGLAAGTTYYYIVTAVNSAGESAASAQASAATTAPPAQTCGSCHAIPPALGAHARHNSSGYGCVTCHGTGYSSTTVNAATHNNGTKDVTISIWNAATRSCAAQCHAARAW